MSKVQSKVPVVVDIAAPDVLRSHYDLAIFSCGYEARATHVARQVDPKKSSMHLMLAYAKLKDAPQRLKNEEYFRASWHPTEMEMDASYDILILKFLNRLDLSKMAEFKILVDYSSMSRMWVAALLNWARYLDSRVGVTIDFVYSVGMYKKHIIPSGIEKIVAIPGCEGGALRFGASVGTFLLGMHHELTQCALELLEPDIVYSYCATPGPFPDEPRYVQDENRSLLEHFNNDIVELPLVSVSTTMSYLAESVRPHVEDKDVFIVPMGPKPHVLASMLVAMQYSQVSCLHIRAIHTKNEVTPPSGELVCTRVIWDHKNIEKCS